MPYPGNPMHDRRCAGPQDSARRGITREVSKEWAEKSQVSLSRLVTEQERSIGQYLLECVERRVIKPFDGACVLRGDTVLAQVNPLLTQPDEGAPQRHG